MSLAEKLDQIRTRAVDRIPAEHLEVMHQATEDLRASGISNGVLGVGDAAPGFELPNIAGEVVRSDDLLGSGPLVVTFYRGVW